MVTLAISSLRAQLRLGSTESTSDAVDFEGVVEREDLLLSRFEKRPSRAMKGGVEKGGDGRRGKPELPIELRK